MSRDRAYYRKQRVRSIKRKKGICKRIGGNDLVRAWSRDKPGRLSKGKIHCSCPMCRIKSFDGKSLSDRKKDIAVAQQLLDCR